MTVRAYIALGSNLDDPQRHVTQALDELAQLPSGELLGASRLYQSKPVGPPQPDYINAVVCLRTTLEPLALLDQLQALEQSHRRVRLEHWGPRTLDLDLLLYGDQVIQLPRLQVPHPAMAERAFVLYPLAEVEPALTLPSGTSLESLLAKCPFEGLTPLTSESENRE